LEICRKLKKAGKICMTSPGDIDPPITISVLMPAFNAAATLRAAVASVQAQSRSDWEILIIDDASKDDTWAVATGLAQGDIRIRTLQHAQNRGAAQARNTALAAARGRYIAFLDADDLWLPEKLARQIAFMSERGAALSYTGFWRARGTGAGEERRQQVHAPAQVTRARLLRGNVIGCLTAIYDRALLGDCPMPDLRMRQDFALWLDILSRWDRAHGLDEPLAIHHVRPGSLTSNRLRTLRATWSMYRAHLGLPAPLAAWYMGHHLTNRLLRPRFT
jgi:teichuronic acid biosynthesis glycosyltransferase TuaG